jgi:PAS domain S-box-containing protein
VPLAGVNPPTPKGVSTCFPGEVRAHYPRMHRSARSRRPASTPLSPLQTPGGSEDPFRHLFERTAEAILLFDRRSNMFVDCNAATLRMLGAATREEVLLQHPWSLSPERQPDGRPSVEKAAEMIAVAIVKGTHRFEWIHRRMDGTPFAVEVMLTSIQFGDRPFIYTVWRDLAERRQAEEARRTTEGIFRVLFERSNDPILLVDTQSFRFTECNRAALALLRYEDPHALIGRTPWDISPPRQPDGSTSEERAADLLSQLAAHGIARFEWIHLRRDGSPLHVEVMLTMVHDVAESPLMLVIWRDIEERKRAEQELLRSLAREKELSELKSSFVSMVSHEFRTPLAVIQSCAEMVRDYRTQLAPEELTQQLQTICESTAHMSQLIDEVLLLGKVDAGQMRFAPAPLEVASFCTQLVDEMHSATQRRANITFVAGRGISAAARGDEALLRHVFTNLIINAVKYSPAGSTVKFACTRQGRDAIFTVTDQGIGIPPDDCTRIFQAFYRGRNVSDIPGSGLGLLIVQRCVLLHRGKVGLQSELGRGTTVTVRLPLFPSPVRKKSPK